MREFICNCAEIDGIRESVSVGMRVVNILFNYVK